MSKLQCIKLAYSIKCGSKEETFFSADKFDIEIVDGIKIKILEKKTKDVTFATIFNAIYFKELPAVENKAILRKKPEVML